MKRPPSKPPWRASQPPRANTTLWQLRTPPPEAKPPMHASGQSGTRVRDSIRWLVAPRGVAGNQQLLIAARLVQVTTIGATGTTSRSLVPDLATLVWPDRQAHGALQHPGPVGRIAA